VLESCGHEDYDPRKKLDSLMHLAELCIEVIQQNEEYHAEVSQLPWLRGPAVERRSLAGVLSLSCARPVADG